MFCHKKHSWIWFAFWSLCAAGVIYFIARMFLNSVAKAEKRKNQDRSASGDAMFV